MSKLDMTPRDALEYARMAEAYRTGLARFVEVHASLLKNMEALYEAARPPFARPRTSAPIDRPMTDEEIDYVLKNGVPQIEPADVDPQLVGHPLAISGR
jgi:hypothetical protein